MAFDRSSFSTIPSVSVISPVGLATGGDWLSSGRSFARYQRERMRDLVDDASLSVTVCSALFSTSSDSGELSVIVFWWVVVLIVGVLRAFV